MNRKFVTVSAIAAAIGVFYAQAEAQRVPTVYPTPAYASAYASLGAAGAGGQPVYVVTSRDVGARATLGGTVVPERDVTLTAQLPGRVVYVIGQEGTRFKRQAVLVALGDDELLAQRNAAIADMNNALYAMQNSQVQYDRQLYSNPKASADTGMGMGMPNMFDQFFTRPMSDLAGVGDSGMGRRADVYGAGASVGQARSQVTAARSRIQQIDSKLRDTRSIAPFEGVISKKFVEVGDTVQPGQPLVKIANDQHLQIRVDVPARLMRGDLIRVGETVPVKLDMGEKLIDTKVAVVFPVADAQRHTVTVKLDLPKDTSARPGMYVEVHVPDTSVPRSAQPWVPKEAVLWRGSLPAVFVLTGNDRKELRMIRVGDADGDGYTVLSGLQEGERIFQHPLPGAVSGWGSSDQR